MKKGLTKLAKEIIEKNQYLVLSTTGQDNKPWTCILAYTFDYEYNFYFISLPNSLHSQNIAQNNNVSFAIYDSTQGFGVGVGLQIEAKAKLLENHEISEATELYFGRKYPYGNISNSFSEGLKTLIKNKAYSFYKLTPTNIWINDPNADTDKRVKVEVIK